MNSISPLLASFICLSFLFTGCSEVKADISATNSNISGSPDITDNKFMTMVVFDTEKGSVILGNPDAEIVLTEYASLTCGHCKSLHDEIMPELKRDYIATGKVRLVFQEFPTPPVQLAMAGFILARCTGPETYFNVLDDFFAAQEQIFTSASTGGVKQELVDIGLRYGVNEAEFDACLQDPQYSRQLSKSVSHARAQDISATPTLYLNGKRMDASHDARTREGFFRILDAALETYAADTTPLPDTLDN